MTTDLNAEQIAFWNGPAGQRWLTRQETQDALLAPVDAMLLERAAPARGEHVLDIGCGCGATSLDVARRVAPEGDVLGVDVSAPMLARARERIPAGLALRFELADAATFAFPPDRADLLVSRFGVMFFADPIHAFANMRRGLRPGGRVAFVCWREPQLNPWMAVPLAAVYRHAPRLPETPPDAPGPFAFADPDRARAILERAGFARITQQRFDVEFDLALARGLDAAVDNVLGIGPASRALDGQPADVRTAAAAAVREALEPFVRGQSVPLPAAVWVVGAAAP